MSQQKPFPSSSPPQTSRFVTPLRYPGGKGRLGPWVAEVMEHNGLLGGCYVEPYAGGAGVAIYLLLNGYASQIIINDSDPAIHKFWRIVTQEPDTLIDKIKNTKPNMKTRRWAQEVLKNMSKHSQADIAFATFFLNRTSYSGILNAGVIGGIKQKGKTKITARYNRDQLIDRIEKIAEQRKKIKVYGMDAISFLKQKTHLLPQNTLVYLDPPYYLKGSQLYRNFYNHNDHLEVSETVKSLKLPTLVTYDDTKEIRRMYKTLKSSRLSLHYSTHRARPWTSEAVFYQHLILPRKPTMYKNKD